MNIEKYKNKCFTYCLNHGTFACPNSSKCLDTKEKPYFRMNKKVPFIVRWLTK